MRPGLVAICAASLALTLAVAPEKANAEPPNHVPLGSIVSHKGNPLEKVGPLKDACGVAVDSSGRAFVANYYEHAVYIFGEKREYLGQVHIDEPPIAPTGKPVDGPCDLAVDSAGDLYVNNWHRNVVRYEPLSPGSTVYGPGTVIDPNYSTGVTIDPASGNVLVDNRTYVAEYEPSGAPVLDGLEPLKIGLGDLGDGYGVAVSGFGATAGRVYVADAAGDTVRVYDRSGGHPHVPVQVIDGGGTPQLGFSDLTDSDLAVDPLDGHLYVVDNLQPYFEEPEAVVDEFSPQGHYRGPVPHSVLGGEPSGIVDAEPSAVAIAAGDVYVTSGNYFADGDRTRDSEVKIFGPTATIVTRILAVSKTGAGAGTVFSSDPAGLGCGTACEGEFELNRVVTLTATPAPHSRFVEWVGCKPRKSEPQKCEVKMDEDHAASAEFEPIPQRTLAVARTGAGTGTVVSSPAGIDCGGSCEGQFDEASTVTLTATAAAGSRLASWSGCDAEPAAGSCAVTIGADRAVAAEFEPVPQPSPPPPGRAQRTLAITSTGTGVATGTVTSVPAGIDCGGVCVRLFEQGTAVTLVAHPAPGSRFLGWGGCDASTGDRCAVTLAGDKTIVAVFGPGFPGPLRLRRLRVSGPTAVLTVAVPAPGALTVSGRALRPASALPLTAGQVALRLSLSRSGLRRLQRAKSHRLGIRVFLALMPFDGGERVVTTKTVAFGQGSGGR
jgi:hypothetical protein